MVSSSDEGTKLTAKSPSTKKPAEQVVKDIRRATRRHFSAEDKIRIVLDGLRGEGLWTPALVGPNGLGFLSQLREQLPATMATMSLDLLAG